MAARLLFIPQNEFLRIRHLDGAWQDRCALLADMCRLNTLVTIKRAGSGHLGSSFSSLDIVTYLYYHEMNTVAKGIHSSDRDIYFSSKGHDVPGLYSVLYSLGILSEELFLHLRRIQGTPGHPHIDIPGMEANTGSLGMGISKARGMAVAKKMGKRGGHVFVMTGDGEFQEGQIYESLLATKNQQCNDITVIIDHNKVQTDKPVETISSLGNLEEKLKAFGWHVERCDGHHFEALKTTFAKMKTITDRPKILIADTIKGRGVSFMEHPVDLKMNQGIYRWHAGAPDDDHFWTGWHEIWNRIQEHCERMGIAAIESREISLYPPLPNPSTDHVSTAFGLALVKLGSRRNDLVVLDADLASDCHLREFEKQFPERFIENGIAEQDMVSMAGGLALQGYLPVVNSFSSFLSARPNEQIYANAGEKTKIIYVMHYSGMIPAGPGQSHQSIRDISLLSSLPNMIVVQPCNARETELLVTYCVEEATDNCMVRLNLGSAPREILLPESYQLHVGRGCTIRDGGDVVLFAYGPVMLNQALIASEILQSQNLSLRVVHQPWLNRFDEEWLQSTISPFSLICVLEDHFVIGGLGSHLMRVLSDHSWLQGKTLKIFGLSDYPAWGTPDEVLRYHELDGECIARKIQTLFKGRKML